MYVADPNKAYESVAKVTIKLDISTGRNIPAFSSGPETPLAGFV